MNKRIISASLCFVIALSLFGVGCNGNKDTTAQNMSSGYDEYSSNGSDYENTTSEVSTMQTTSDEYFFEGPPEDQFYSFPENTFSSFPSGNPSGGVSNSSNGTSDKNQSSSGPSNSSADQTRQEYIDTDLNPEPLNASYDGLLDKNPDRGFRTEFVLYIKETKRANDDPRTAYIDKSESEIRSQVEKVFNIYFNTAYSTNKTFLAYIYITDFRDDDISKAAPVLEMFFKICRERKVKSMLRFCYNNSYALNFELSRTNKDLLASECADQATMLKHITQLKPYISKYKDTIHSISCGFVGFVGEWAYHYQYPSVDYPTVIKAIVENLCVPNNLYFSIRMPAYKEQLEKNYKYRNYISHNNDAMYGEQTNYGWHSENFQYGHSNGWWDYVTRVAAYTPQDGEMYTNAALFSYNIFPKGLDVILECAHHRHTSMSNWHGYLEALSRDNIISRWINNETVTPSILDSKKILYDPNWFINDKGESVNRNPYQFLKDHLGYKLCAVGGHIKGKLSGGSSLNVELQLKNYGFAAAFNLSSGFAILDSNLKEVVSVEAGNPEEWYSHAPDNSATTTALTHTVKADIKLPSKSGKYYVAFYLKNTMNDRARLSNKIQFLNGYNILGSIEL